MCIRDSSHWANLSPDKQQRLKTLLAANKRLNTAYVLKEQFGQLWTYRREPWARRFFEQWRAALRWQRLKPFEEFAAVIERHWDCLLYTSDAADERSSVDLGGRRIIKKKKKK